jgi:hypothetical protein
MPRRTALIVVVPEAEPFVGALRLEHDWSAARGIPAHVTVLFPFAPADEIDETALTVLFDGFPAFDFELDRIGRFEEGPVWLHPEPSGPFTDLTEAVHQRWPEYPPYEGVHDEVIPHLTVGDTPLDLTVPLPIACRAKAVTLYEEDEATGMWSLRSSFALAQGVA